MVAMKSSNRWRGLLGAAVVMSSAAGYSGSDSSYYIIGCLDGKFVGWGHSFYVRALPPKGSTA